MPLDFIEIEHSGFVATVSASDSVALSAFFNRAYCRVKRSYAKPQCAPGEVCHPVEGHFVTEREVKGCERFN